ncbi:MAG: M20/M25/M40 family metallo-hydrolase [Kiritimatiellae bacterium]|nr:M20/M25/M40 family metallo-hydrolase [Kiritimatiellia bacterium]
MNEEIGEWLKSNDSKEYFELLRLPTVGADPARLRDCVQAATWLREWLKSIGAEAGLVLPEGAPGQSASVPVVFGELKGAEGATTVLIYGHYDVQPPDPLDLWETPPFEPTVKGDRVYCRGAQDDKGQMFAFLCGVRELVAKGGPTPTVKFVLDGQEESGSGTLFKLLGDREFRRKIAADAMLVCDTSAAADLRPAIVAGLRGVNHFTVKLAAANRDLHSGEYGGIAPNAAQGMAELMASLHNADGSIAVAGFCDGMEPPTDEELAAAEAGFADAAAYEKDIGTEPCGGAAGRSIVQRNCFDPTIEVNGIHTGYGGPGSKTVIPCEAIAKLSTRLVPGQNPARSYEAVKAHLAERCPKGMEVSFPEECGLSAAMRLPLASPLFRLAEGVLAEMDPRGAVFLWDGASIPVVSALREATCAAPLLVGWGQPEDRIHSPNESFSLRQFAAAKEWAGRILAAI